MTGIKPSAGQVWKMKGDTFKNKYVFVTEVLARYVGKMEVGFSVRYKSIELLDEYGSAVMDESYFKKQYEWVSG